MNKKSLLIAATGVTLFLGVALPAYANPVPEFGSCLNPQWSKTQENSGSNHGVVGVGTFAGVDSIYASGGNVLQCLCTDQGKGYQTNWLKASGLSNSQIDNLKAQGWKYVAYGEDWGLDKSAYLAKNSEYTCATCTPTPTVTPTTTTTPGETATPTPETKVEGASATNSLAPTGNAFIIYMTILAGAASLITGMILKKFSK